MKIFDNNSDVLQIGALTIENDINRITISGDVQICHDDGGRTQAQLLYDFAEALLARFDDPPCAEVQAQAMTVVKNPFA